MSHTTLFEVGCRPGVTDPVGHGLGRDIAHLGLARVKTVASAQLYRVKGHLTAENRARISKDLLCDPILNESHEGRSTPGGKSMVIDVWYKAGVTDVVGDSVRKGIQDLNIQGIEDVRTGMRYHLHGVTRKEIAQKVALALLVNPLVHDWTIHAD